MMQVLPPNKDTIRAAAQLALKYLDEEPLNKALIKAVISNMIDGLNHPDFGCAALIYPYVQSNVVFTESTR